jgi:hypothetical protein
MQPGYISPCTLHSTHPPMPPPPPPGSSVRESAFLASSIRYTLGSRQQITGDVSRLWQNGGKHIGITLAEGNSDTSTPSATSQPCVNLQNSDDEIRETRGGSRKVKISIPKRDTIIQPNSRMPCFRSGKLPYICICISRCRLCQPEVPTSMQEVVWLGLALLSQRDKLSCLARLGACDYRCTCIHQVHALLSQRKRWLSNLSTGDGMDAI